MSRLIRPPSSVLLLVGREDFTPPTSFGGAPCAATPDCLAVAVRDVEDGPTLAELTDDPGAAGLQDLMTLGDVRLESEGLLVLRNVYSREYGTVGVEAGTVRVRVLADDDSEPGHVVFLVGGPPQG
ncbi:hypothetical protein ABKW28_11540 [Nocardioides sp. 31GB23]|uniref:hypothetical protein n=1 Tax=Nocardioides sp. 31GB23 TaxID=3156065 RepID=UPI0032AFF8E5